MVTLKLHKADNGPPFNSSAFQTFSDQRGIQVKHTPPYHPQANEAECFMKPLGKAVKIALDTKQPIKQAVDELLQSYRATPNKATGVAPGDMMFRGGYRSKFPYKEPPSDNNIHKAIKQDIANKQHRNQERNNSRWRKYHDIQQGDKVLILRAMRSGKFQSIYEPEPYIVINQNGALYQILRQSDNYTTFRHINDLKPYHGKNQLTPHHHILTHRWSSPATSTPTTTQQAARHTNPPPSPHQAQAAGTPTRTTPDSRIPRLVLKNNGKEWMRQNDRPKRQIKPPARYIKQ